MAQSIATDPDCLIHSENLRIGFGIQTLMGPINMVVKPAELHVLTGPNGIGKTTFLKTLGGLKAPLSGNIYTKTSKIFYLSSTPSLFLNQTVSNNVEFLCNSLKIMPSRDDIGRVLEEFELDKKRFLGARYLSSGQKRRLTLAAVALTQPHLILADEPTNALDKKGLRLFDDLLETVLNYGGSFIIATHDEALARRPMATVHGFEGQGSME